MPERAVSVQFEFFFRDRSFACILTPHSRIFCTGIALTFLSRSPAGQLVRQQRLGGLGFAKVTQELTTPPSVSSHRHKLFVVVVVVFLQQEHTHQ